MIKINLMEQKWLHEYPGRGQKEMNFAVEVAAYFVASGLGCLTGYCLEGVMR